MKNSLSYVIGGIGILLLLAGVIWDIAIYFQNWDVLLTYSDRFTLLLETYCNGNCWLYNLRNSQRGA